MNKQLLFVDDEPGILQGLKRSLRSMRREWDMQFVNSGAEALSLMKSQHFDAIVSDMRMPGMTGAELLQQVSEIYPDTFRIILSGYSDEELSMKAAITAHQFLAKPCEAETLIRTLKNTFQLAEHLGEKSLETFISGLNHLPSMPQVYMQLFKALKSPDSTIHEIAEIIGQDPAMTAKILQMVNSAFFGLGREVSNVQEATRLIGFDSIKALVLSVGIFSQFKDESHRFDFTQLQDHYLSVAQLTKDIAQSMNSEKRFVDDCFLAGMLHDIGIMIVLKNHPEQFIDTASLILTDKLEIDSDQHEEPFRFLHGIVGAYLLGIWGLKHNVVEAVAYHQYPRISHIHEFTPLAALHIADALVDQQFSLKHNSSPSVLKIDTEYLQRLGLLDKLSEWKQLLEEQKHE